MYVEGGGSDTCMCEGVCVVVILVCVRVCGSYMCMCEGGGSDTYVLVCVRGGGGSGNCMCEGVWW